MGPNLDPTNLVEQIYEAAFVPELWAATLDKLGASARSPYAGMILYEDIRPARLAANAMRMETARKFVMSDRWVDNQRIPYFHKNPFTGFVIAKDYFPPAFLEQDAVHLIDRQAGLLHQIGTMIPMPSGEMVIYAFDRTQKDDPYRTDDIELLNKVYAHLARAGLIAARLRLEQATSTTSTLQAMGLAAAVASSMGQVRASNALFDAMSAVFQSTAFGGVRIADNAANDLFLQALESIRTHSALSVCSIPVRATHNSPAVVIHVLPLRRNAHDIFSGADILIVATAINPSNLVPSPTILTGLFDLTPTEARLVIALTRGESLKTAAAEAAVNYATARTYLNRIYTKTGTHRQNELVALLKWTQPLEPKS